MRIDADSVRAGMNDPIAEAAMLAGEPSCDALREALPELVGYVPVASEAVADKLVMDESGRIGRLGDHGAKGLAEVLFDPEEQLGEGARLGSASLLEGWLPAIAGSLSGGGELLAVPAVSADGFTLVRAVLRGERHHWALDPLREVPPGVFDEALAAATDEWRADLSSAARVKLPESVLVDASLAAIARTISTFEGYHPKYGLGAYSHPMHDGFPPTFIFMLRACLEWGLVDRAEGYLSHWFERFVRPDGTFDYYGPAVSEYGQVLDGVARFVRYTGDRGWLEGHLTQVRAIADHLVSLRRESLAQPAGSPARGLLFGSPEADTRDQKEYHFSGTAWAWRGLLELGRLLGGDTGAELLRECRALRRDLLAAARAALLPGDPPFLPPYPGIERPFERMTAGTLESYTNYRYWPELLSAGALEPDLADAVMEFRKRRGGELAGTTRFADHLDDWPLAHHAWGLLQADLADRFILTLYGHLALQQTPGTYCAYEQVSITGDPRRLVADYCVPAQLTVPLMVRWMLLHDDPDTDRLWLARALPRRWLAPGERIRIEGAPTPYGPVSYSIETDERRCRADVELPGPVREVALRLRRPGGAVLSRVTAEGANATTMRDGETVLLRPTKATVTVEAT